MSTARIILENPGEIKTPGKQQTTLCMASHRSPAVNMASARTLRAAQKTVHKREHVVSCSHLSSERAAAH